MTQSDIIAIDGKCLRRSLDKASNKAAICVVSNPRQIHPLSNMGSAGLKIHDNLFFQSVFYFSGESFRWVLSKIHFTNTKKPPLKGGLL